MTVLLHGNMTTTLQHKNIAKVFCNMAIWQHGNIANRIWQHRNMKTLQHDNIATWWQHGNLQHDNMAT
jgi:hypothetical protein